MRCQALCCASMPAERATWGHMADLGSPGSASGRRGAGAGPWMAPRDASYGSCTSRMTSPMACSGLKLDEWAALEQKLG